MTILFMISLGILVYVVAGYPLMLWIWSRCRAPHFAGPVADWPRLAVVVPIYNEERVIEEKLRNCLAIEYPPDRLSVVFVSDGSTDASVSLLRKCGDPRVRIVVHPGNRGKAAILNETISGLDADLIMLTDASGMLNPDAAKLIVPHFEDREIGAVCGVYRVFKDGGTRYDAAEGSYHGFEMLLRIWEGRIRTTLSGTGSLFVIRRHDYPGLPADVVNDDYVLPALLALEGKRIIYEPRAILFDRIATSLARLLRRRARIAFGNWQQLRYLAPLMNPMKGYLCWVFVSHKLLRMFVPLLILLAIIGSFAVSPWICGLLLAGACGAIGVGGVALLTDRRIRGHNKFGFIPLIFLNCLAVLLGTWDYIRGRGAKW